MSGTEATEATEALLDAGAVLPAGTDAAKDTVDTLSTREYTHSVLGDRRVVRLVPATLGQAEDLTMEFLGFAPPSTIAEVGIVRQQALGFPAWALVHDPANGHHALALVKDIERLVRVAKSRIGPARDGFNELGDRLARAVPHFLPTFYEEAARAFLAADSQTYAASMFGKARDAERTYALEIDEERQHAVFLEFALAGALTAKALAAHARDLAARCAPAVAYERFRRLCVERTLGGMPPYAQMHVDLGRLAKAAGLGAEEDEALLAELMAAPSLLRAPGGFWKAYRPALVRLARRDPRVRGQLLGVFPRECPLLTWLDILEESGAVRALTEPAGSVEPEAESSDGPAGWLARVDESRGWRKPREPRLLALLERMADRLRADGVPADLARAHRGVDLDLYDLAMELGVPLAEVDEHARCDVEAWLRDENDGRRDLARVAGQERLRPVLADSIESHLTTWYRSDQAAVAPDRVERVAAVPGLRAALHWWLDQLAERVEQQGLTTVGEELDRLTKVACPAGLAVNPEAVARITAFDLGPVLGRTLRAGVLAEFAWPALDAGVAAVRGDDRRPLNEDLTVTPQWPALVLRHGDRVAVVGDEGVELEHTLRIPPEERRYSWHTAVRYVDGQLLVAWSGQQRKGYWSGAPDDVHTGEEDGLGDAGEHSLALPGGGRTAGGRPLHPGDRRAQELGTVVTDGRHYWVRLYNQGDSSWHWHEYDPATGERGRVSLPGFFEAGAVDGQPLLIGDCRLRPASPRMAGSPLGHHDGLVGWRVRRTPDGQAGEAVDGQAFAMPDPPRTARRYRTASLAGAIRFPGADAPHGLFVEHAWRSTALYLHTADGLRFASLNTGGEEDNPFAGGWPLVPPADYWHQLRPRDEAGSRALRALGDDAAGRLLAAVSALAGAEQDKAKLADAAVAAAVREALPELGDAALVAGVAGVVRHAARAALRLARLTGTTAEIVAQAPVLADPDAHLPGDDVLDEALRGLIPGCYNQGHVAVKMFIDGGAALGGREPRAPMAPWAASADLDWYDTLGVLPSVVLRAAGASTSAAHRAALLDLLDVVAGSGFVDGDGRTRRVRLDSVTGRPVLSVGEAVTVGDGRRLLPFRVDPATGQTEAIEHAAGGRFGAIDGHTIAWEKQFERHGIDAAGLARFAAAGRAHGGPADLLRPDTVRAVSAAAGISLAEATVLLAGATGGRSGHEDLPAGFEPAGPGVTDYAIDTAVDRFSRNGEPLAAGGTAALVPDDPARLWTEGPDAARFGAWRTEQVGARTPVADELITDCRRAGITERGFSASEFLHGIANPETCRWLHAVDGGAAGFHLLGAVARGLPWLARRLPQDDPLRRGLPRVLELVRALVADPAFELLLAGGEEQRVDKALAALGLPLQQDGKRTDAGVLVADNTGYWRQVWVRPSRMEGVDDPRVAAVLAALDGNDRTLAALKVVLGDALDAWLEAEPGDAPHDPSRSAPQLVTAVAERHGLGADAAALYLQLLALPDPTDRNVAAWTGWKPARLKAARAELTATDLVVEAKRPRAGRSLFLPGGWLAWKAPLPPLERWKLPLLLGSREDGTGLGAVVPVAPAPRLFRLAWDRIEAGDHPRFEELTTRGRR